MTIVKITQEVLDAAGCGRGELHQIRSVRGILEAAGLTVEPHPRELEEVARIRAVGQNAAEKADQLARELGLPADHPLRS